MPDPNFAPVFRVIRYRKTVTGSLYNDEAVVGVSVIAGLVDVRTLKLEILLWLFWMRELKPPEPKIQLWKETENDVAQGYLGKIPIIKIILGFEGRRFNNNK